jgi:Phage integrase, N-terminal SAM-like domain
MARWWRGRDSPALVAAAGNRAQECFIEFFTANIRNRNTRRGCAQAVSKFLAWCEDHRVPSITAVRPVRVAGYIEELTHAHSAPTAKQRLSAIRHLFDWLVVGQVRPTNPASSVRRSSHVVKRGKTPVLSPDAIDVSTHAGLRDRALTPAVLQGGEHPLAAPVPPANTRECGPRPDASAPDQPGSAGPLLTDRPPAGCALRTPPHGGLAASMDGWAWSMAIPSNGVLSDHETVS